MKLFSTILKEMSESEGTLDELYDNRSGGGHGPEAVRTAPQWWPPP
jgi:hypothetical protein